MTTYRCRRNFRIHNTRFKVGDVFKGSKDKANDLLNRGLIYESKEDKRPYFKDDKYTLEKDSNTKTMYYVMKGNQVIDRLSKSKAENLVKEMNDGILIDG